MSKEASMLLIGVDSEGVAGIHAIAAVVEVVQVEEQDMRRRMMGAVETTPQVLVDVEAAGEDLTTTTGATTLAHLAAVEEGNST